GQRLGDAVMVEMLDRHQLGEALDAAEMIQVPVRDDVVVDGAEVGAFGGDFEDAFGVALAGVAAVDQHRLTGRRDDQRGRPAFGVDEVNVEPAFGRLGPYVHGGQQQGGNEEKSLHGD